jgi:formamidopyrimidine-DNA glycosylase
MPELPEVEVIRRGLAPLLPGRRIIAFSCSKKKLRLPVPRKAFACWVKGEEVVTVERRAKYLLLRLTGGAVVIFHLGMTGRLGLFSSRLPRLKHDHLRFVLDNDLELRFNDARRFGSIQVAGPGAMLDDLFAGLGPEPLGKDLTPAYLLAKARNRQQPVKNFLMDGRVVAGIGNIYASEILFQAGIDPLLPAAEIAFKQWQVTVRSCRNVLQQAIAAGGTTISNYVNASGGSGYFQLQLQVYDREGEPCRRCGNPVFRIVLAGRSTFFCKHCQPRPAFLKRPDRSSSSRRRKRRTG